VRTRIEVDIRARAGTRRCRTGTNMTDLIYGSHFCYELPYHNAELFSYALARIEIKAT
jgi:hypothetical protein